MFTHVFFLKNVQSCPKIIFFFYLREAFPRVWRHCISEELYEIGLRDNLPSILQSFLNDRSLMVRIQNKTSSPLPIVE